jgi:acetyl-CoA acetyltransferase
MQNVGWRSDFPSCLSSVNERFVSVVNVLGSGCGPGHPVAMTGAGMVPTLIHERRRGGGTAVAAMCAGGGMASALVLEVSAPS